MSELTTVSKRLIKDYMSAHNLSARDVPITNDLLISARGARAKYHCYLEESRRNEMMEESKQEIKELKTDLKNTLKEKEEKQRLISSLREEALEFFGQASMEKAGEEREALMSRGRSHKAESEKLKVDLEELNATIERLKEKLNEVENHN